MTRDSLEALLARVASDPASVLDEMRAEEERQKNELAETRQRIRLVEKFASASAEWRSLDGTAAPDSDDDPSTAQLLEIENQHVRPADGTSQNVVGIPQQPRRHQVLGLLGQDPSRWWKTREVGEALGIANLKSLRVTLSKMADQGDLVKNADASYRFNDGLAAASSESSRDGRSAVV